MQVGAEISTLAGQRVRGEMCVRRPMVVHFAAATPLYAWVTCGLVAFLPKLQAVPTDIFITKNGIQESHRRFSRLE